jgi:hypothetical protein
MAVVMSAWLTERPPVTSQKHYCDVSVTHFSYSLGKSQCLLRVKVLRKFKISVTSRGLETATLCLVAHFLNHRVTATWVRIPVGQNLHLSI